MNEVNEVKEHLGASKANCRSLSLRSMRPLRVSIRASIVAFSSLLLAFIFNAVWTWTFGPTFEHNLKCWIIFLAVSLNVVCAVVLAKLRMVTTGRLLCSQVAFVFVCIAMLHIAVIDMSKDVRCSSVYAFDAKVKVVVQSLPQAANRRRLETLTLHLKDSGITTYEILNYSVSASSLGWMSPRRASLWNKTLIALTTYAALPSEWVLILEDDAVLYSNFKKSVEFLLACGSGLADMYFLDARSYISYYWNGFPMCCTAGMLYRRSAMAKIAAYLEFDSLAVFEYLTETMANDHAIDLFFGFLCSKGYLKCGVKQLVRESGSESTIVVMH